MVVAIRSWSLAQIWLYTFHFFLNRRYFGRKCETDCDLFQWRGGSKYCLANVESLISLKSDVIGINNDVTQNCDVIEVKVRGALNMEKECFFFLEEILGVIDQVKPVDLFSITVPI